MPSEPLSGIGPYRLTHVLGQGSMGVVYAGEHPGTGALVAVKTVIGAEASKLSQIRREIRSLARLDHPGVVRILDHGVSDGLPWYAMERLQGATVADVFERYWSTHRTGSAAAAAAGDTMEPATPTATDLDATFDLGRDGADAQAAAWRGAGGGFGGAKRAAAGQLGEVLSLAHRICEILAYVHGEGIVHRDLKPGNVFLRDDRLPVLVDFGLVSEASGAVGREVIEAAQPISGSPPYMAPEQLRGDALDARCDLYALGCMLYQLVTGAPPFGGTRRQVFLGHLERTPVRPSDLVAGVPPALDDLIMSLLAKARDDRVGYAGNVALSLEGLGSRPRPWPSPPPPARPYLYRAAFVGRGETAGRMSGHLESARRGVGRMLLLTGESGSGKTRQALEAAAQAQRAGMAVVSGRCLAGGFDGAPGNPSAQPLHPFLPLLEAAADACLEGGPGRGEALLGPHAAVLAAYSPHLKSLPEVAGLPEPPPLPADDARRRLFRALRDLLAAYARLRPLLLIVDDLQWADELSLGFLDLLARDGVEELPLLILGTLRSEERVPALDALLASPNIVGVELARMGLAEVEAMAGGMLALNPLPSLFAGFLAERSSGNPFFIAEYLRSAVSERVLLRDRAGRWTFAEGETLDGARYEALPLPQSLRDLIELRLGRLGSAARRAVDSAALIGRHFEAELVRRVEGFDEEELGRVIDELVARQILEAEETEGFRFLHDKIREVADSRQAPDRRRGLHRRIAEQLEAMHADGEARAAVHGRLGRHWAGAGVADKAAGHLRLAAERAQRFHAVDEAVELFGAALAEIAAVRGGHPERPDHWRREALAVNEALSDALSLKRRHEPARAALEAALADSGGDRVAAARLHRKTGKTWEGEHRHEAALAAYDEAEAALAGGDETVDGWMDERILIKLGRLWIHYWSARARELESELADSRLLIERHGRPEHRYHFYLSQILSNLRRDRYRVPPETVELGRRLLTAALDSRGLVEIAFARFELGFILLFAGELEAAEAELLQARELSRRVGDASGETRTLCYHVILLCRMGRVDQGEAAARDLLDKATANRMTDYVGIAHAALGWAALKRGDGAAAADRSRRAMAVWAELPFVYSMQWTAALTALRLAFDRGDDGRLAELATLLRHPVQLWLPDAIDGALGRMVAAHQAGDAAALRAGARDAVGAAEALGYL